MKTIKERAFEVVRAMKSTQRATIEEGEKAAWELLQEIANAPEPVGYTNATELDYVRTAEVLPASGGFWRTSDEDTCVALYTAPPTPSVPVLTVECEPDYWSGGHYYEGTKPYIAPTAVWKLPIGTELYTAPPANNQSEQHLEMVNPQAPSVPDVAQTIPSHDQITQILNGLDRCGVAESKRAFLRTWIRYWTAHKLSAAPTPAEAPADVERDAARYRWLRTHGLQRAWVSLGTDFEGGNFASFRCEFNLPEPPNLPYEDDEGLQWADKDFDAAIDAAITAEKGQQT